jgi:type II secretory pathway pseudopilin PulG
MSAPVLLRRRFATRAARQSGYTVVEILLAMTVLMIGASGVMSMQKAAIQGNLDSRKTDVATNIARMWMERVQKDAMNWTLPSPSFASPSNYGNAPLLGHTTGLWFLPTDYLPPASGTAAISPGFDILGRDIQTVGGLSNAIFCVHLRENWLVQNAVTPTDSLMRVELRVVWPRGVIVSTTTSAPTLCSVSAAATPNPNAELYSTLYMVTAVRANGIQ